MPKLKTHKATAKRIMVTGSGKLMRMKGYRSHLRRNRAKRAKQLFDRKLAVRGAGEIKRIRKLVPYLD